MDELRQILSRSFLPDAYKFVLSKPVNADEIYKKITGNKTKTGYQIEKFTQTQVFHENLNYEETFRFLENYLKKRFRQLNAWDKSKEYEIKISKKEKILFRSSKAQNAPHINENHNKEKNYLLKEGEKIPPLIDMGVLSRDGQVVKSKYDKFRQINRFLEIICDEIKKTNKQSLNIVDFGCGKSYLTFVLYYYLTKVENLDVKITGLDLKKDVITKCNQAAQKYNYHNLFFEIGDISRYDFKEKPDMVISLHACDTATDYALYNAIQSKADLIFSVPCCQHELNQQIESSTYSILTKYGIIKEKLAALMTDAIRGNILEYCGYKTQIMEFIDMEHTPKNILIRAVKRKKITYENLKALEEAEKLMEEFHLTPTLYTLIKKSEETNEELR